MEMCSEATPPMGVKPHVPVDDRALYIVFCAFQDPEEAGKLPLEELAGTIGLDRGDPSDHFLDSGRIAPVCEIDTSSHSGCFSIMSIQADKHVLSVITGFAEQIGTSVRALVLGD
jgi:hypothetical protein